MRPLLTAIIFLTITQHISAQTLFTYGNVPVSKQEFLRAYQKNSNNEKADEKTYREYLDLYIRFKLKVRAGYAQKLDTTAQQRIELQNFRSQVSAAYMNDEAAMDQLIDEAFMRAQKDLSISHIYIPFNAGDTLAAKQKAADAYRALKSGRAFEEVARQYSSDPSVNSNGGALGYITALSLPYKLEDLAYSTPAGKFSAPFKSSDAYHIFKVNEERKAAGTSNVAHILLAYPPTATAEQKVLIDKRADSIYKALTAGASFKLMAEKYSSDNSSFMNGGQIPPVTVGRYDAEFEKAVFALRRNGEISKPVATAFGVHIIQLIGHTPVPADKKDAVFRNELKQKIAADSRMEVARKALITKVQKLAPYRKGKLNQAHLAAYTDSVLHAKKLPSFADLKGETIIFSLGEENATLTDLGKYLAAIRNSNHLISGKTAAQLFDQYAETVAMEYYRDHLERFDTGFAYQLKDFKDGNLLFETMQRNVWEKASADTMALKKYYQQHADKYWWQPGVDGIIISVPDLKVAKEVMDTIDKHGIDNWRDRLVFDGLVQSDSGRFEYAQLSLPPNMQIREKQLVELMQSDANYQVSFLYVIRKHDQKAPRSYDDARGFVLNDHQQELEEQWISELKKRYPVKVNEAVLKTLWQ